MIEGFERLDPGAALAVRTRIEDGQFVGWVSYPDVVAAQSAFFGFRDILTNSGLSVRLQTRDEMIPQDWLVRSGRLAVIAGDRRNALKLRVSRRSGACL